MGDPCSWPCPTMPFGQDAGSEVHASTLTIHRKAPRSWRVRHRPTTALSKSSDWTRERVYVHILLNTNGDVRPQQPETQVHVLEFDVAGTFGRVVMTTGRRCARCCRWKGSTSGSRLEKLGSYKHVKGRVTDKHFADRDHGWS